MKRFSFLLLLAAAACSTSTGKPSAPPPAAAGPAPTPTPSIRARIDPTVVEENDTTIIRRLPKKDYIKVDEHNIREPILPNQLIPFFKEDADYYYVSEPKDIPEEVEAKRQALAQQPNAAPGSAPSTQKPPKPSEGVTAADFENLDPPRTGARIRLVPVADPGLPVGGMWRASFVMADMNGDKIPDIVAPPNRLGNGKLRVWLGNGKGGFTEWPLAFTESGKPLPRFTIDYGGVAVGDIDGDGNLDVVSASHGQGIVALFGDGKGTFRVVRAGLPRSDFSSQAVALLDANGDGKLDIIASRDVPTSDQLNTVDKLQVRVYLYSGKDEFQWKKDGLIGGFYSNSLAGFDYDGDGRKDILTGSNYTGALTLLWKSKGDGTFEPVSFDGIELYAYHPTTAPGTWGKARVPAFVDAYSAAANVPTLTRATGISVYSFQAGKWERHRAWREKEGRSSVTAVAMGDLDGDGLDDIVFADNAKRRVRILLQQPDGSFMELDEKLEPAIESPGQWIKLVDLDGDGRLDIVLSRTVTSAAPNEVGGWNVYLNKAK